MKKLLNLKALMLSLCMAALGVLHVNAQKSDAFISGIDDNFNRDVLDYFIIRGVGDGISLGGATTTDPTAPLGSGLLIMVAAGAGYAVARSKRTLRKSATLLLACLLVLGLTQCKKSVDTLSNSSLDGVQITLNANVGGDKTGFVPGTTTGVFTWTDGVTEYIYVGGNKHEGCIGKLSGTGNGSGEISFTGSVTASDDEELYFFYLGNGEHDGATVLDFSTQYGDCDHVTNNHIAIGHATYSGQTTFSVELEMAMSIAYFDLSGYKNSTNDAEIVYLHGDDIYATAAINYSAGTITGSTKGFINVGTATAGQYVALIPSGTGSETTLKFDSNSKTGSITFINGIEAGKFYSKTEGDNLVALPVSAVAPLEGTTPGLFSVEVKEVGANRVTTKMVRFSKGNLQATTIDGWSTYTWSFKDHQYDMDPDGDVGDNYEDRNVISHFGYGTSGYEGKHPYMTSDDGTDYPLDNIAETEFDWGVHNAILNGGNERGLWRTLTIGASITSLHLIGEWRTIFVGRAGNHYAKAFLFGETDHGVHGVIVLPDNFSHPDGISPLEGIDCMDEEYWNHGNMYNDEDWAKMEAAGCVFLPAAGQRDGTDIDYIGDDGWGICSYYSSIADADDSWHEDAFSLQVRYPSDSGPALTSESKQYGNSVRLVCDVE